MYLAGFLDNVGRPIAAGAWFRTGVNTTVQVALAGYLFLSFMRQLARIVDLHGGRYSNNRVVNFLVGKRVWNRWPLPIFTFFSNPPLSDLRVCARGVDAFDHYTPWQCIKYRHPGFIRCLWNPDRRRQKVVMETAIQFLKKLTNDLEQGKDDFLSADEYCLLVMASMAHVTEDATAWQFLLCRVFVDEKPSAPEILFISRVEGPVRG